MTQDPAPRTRSNTAGCAVLAVCAAALGLIAACVALTLAVTGFFDRPATPPDELLAKKAGLTQYRLRQAISDGNLSDEEIARAADGSLDGSWSTWRVQGGIRIVVAYAPGPVCYQYEITQPVTATTPVRRTRLEQCPTLPKHGP
ncbi:MULTISPECIES: hypothetical protein [unclassified Streptomyces]|uniref:hypothetical protein n=1 Tax=unclassified Streptomyces TaxID=2593676 RepID=UPI00365F8723